MKRTPLVRKTPLRRIAPPKRRTPVRKVAITRRGFTAAETEAMKQLARAVTMTSVGAALMSRAGNSRAKQPQWYGHCQWCHEETFLQWCHIRGRRAAPSLITNPLNAFAACSSCHGGRWHYAKPIDPRLDRPDDRRTFLESIRTPDQIDFLYSKPERIDPALQALRNFERLDEITGGHGERAMWPEHLKLIGEIIGRPDLALRADF